MTYQYACFLIDPKYPHIKAARYLVHYFIGTRDKGYYINLHNSEGLKVHVDADFSGNWDNTKPELDCETVSSRYRYIISYIDSPIIWKLQLQTEIALSSTKSEYIGLSYALREAIPNYIFTQ